MAQGQSSQSEKWGTFTVQWLDGVEVVALGMGAQEQKQVAFGEGITVRTLCPGCCSQLSRVGQECVCAPTCAG